MRRPVYDLTQPGWAIAIAIAALFSIGLASIYAATEVNAAGRTLSGAQFALKQGIAGLVSLIAAGVLMRIGYQWIARRSYIVLAAGLLLLLPMLAAKLLGTSFGGLVPESRGSYRSIHLPGYNIQPSELMKVAYILALAWYLRHRKTYRRFWGLLIPVVLSLVPMGLILVEPDLGTGILFIPVLFGMLFIAGARIKHLGLLALAGVLVAPLVWFHMKPYQRSRVMTVLLQSNSFRSDVAADPEAYDWTGVSRRDALQWKVSTGMQLVQSKAALGSGGLLGQGWGRGAYVEYNILPDRHNDFVFAIIGHQWGLLGCLTVLACYTIIVLAGVEIASVTQDPFGRLLAMGVVCLIAAQALINVGMTIGLMPITGMTLPFISYGGSSLLTNALAAALLISVSQHRPFMLCRRPFEWSETAERKPVISADRDYATIR